MSSSKPASPVEAKPTAPVADKPTTPVADKPLTPSPAVVTAAALTPASAPVVAPPSPPTPLPSKWAPVKNRKSGEDNITWAGRIYDAMVGDPIGTRKSPWEGGVNFISGALNGLNELNKDVATNSCGNPCWWYYNNPGTSQESKTKIDNAGLCDCKNNVPINFQRIRYWGY